MPLPLSPAPDLSKCCSAGYIVKCMPNALWSSACDRLAAFPLALTRPDKCKFYNFKMSFVASPWPCVWGKGRKRKSHVAVIFCIKAFDN